MRVRMLPALLLLLSGAVSWAQSNELVDALLGQERARIDFTAYMVFTASGALPEEASPQEALALMIEKGWATADRQGDSPILLDEYCYLVMAALGLKGGLLYSVFPGPRYAYRELVFLGIANQSGGPRRSLAGDEVLRILRMALELKGGVS